MELYVNCIRWSHCPKSCARSHRVFGGAVEQQSISSADQCCTGRGSGTMSAVVSQMNGFRSHLEDELLHFTLQ